MFGESYRHFLNGADPTGDILYTPVPPGKLLLPPGYYSWWGVEPVEESIFGSCKFSVGFKEILATFQNLHRREDHVPHLMFRKAGTLHYKKEICYVIAVHASTDDGQHICNLPPVSDQEKRFDFGNVLDGAGVVKQAFLDGEVQRYPQFRKEFHDKEIYPYYWETVAFTFYCSSPQPLRIAQDSVQVGTVEHKQCMKSRVKDGKWICPNDLH